MACIVVELRVEEADVAVEIVDLLDFSRSKTDLIGTGDVLEKACILGRLDEWDALPLHMPSEYNLRCCFSLCSSNLLDDCIFKHAHILVLALSHCEVPCAN